jgi:hypothetical protein
MPTRNVLFSLHLFLMGGVGEDIKLKKTKERIERPARPRVGSGRKNEKPNHAVKVFSR